MSIQHKRRKIYTRRDGEHQAKPAIPVWAELQRLGEVEARELAAAHGIEWAGRMRTLSALNRARG